METVQEYSIASNDMEFLSDHTSKRANYISNTVTAVFLCCGLFSVSLPASVTNVPRNSRFSYSVPRNDKRYEKYAKRDEKDIIELKKMNIISDIRDLSLLENDWDGYGAIKVLPICINNSINIINSKIISCDYVDDIYANPNGTVSIIWDNQVAKSTVGLEVGETEMSFYYLNGNKQEIVNHVPFNEESYTQLSKLLCQL